MKTSFPVLCLFVFLSTQSLSQSNYEIITDSVDGTTKIYKGQLKKSDLTRFAWYAESQKIYPHPAALALENLTKFKDSVSLVVFLGTWCEDSHFVVPKLLKLQEESGFPEDSVSLYGVDRTKKSTGTLTHDYAIVNVPTIIVMKKGREVGRVVEYGKTGIWDQEFGELFAR